MFEVKVVRHFSAAHRVEDYPGNCERLHGHNWKVEVVVGAMELDPLGMVVDFRRLKEKVDRVKDSHYTFMRLSSPTVELEATDFTRAYMPEANIPTLHEAAAAAGYFNMFPDVDGTVRWVPMTIQCQDKF